MGRSYLNYILNDVFQGIRGVQAKAMFGGYGLYKDGIIFGIIADDELYFKVDDSNRKDYVALGSEPFSYSGKNGKKMVMSYYRVPAEISEDKAEIESWIEKSCQISKLKERKTSVRRSR